ncbi:hypothetical protein C8R46DRAFT_1084750 [Mycena filopes]|nr:hypothetical protein C8R46DRAFT_1084750 [Mycena filopes]
MAPSSALGELSNRVPQYQNQYTLVTKNGQLRYAAVGRRALALPPELLAEIFLCSLPGHGRLNMTMNDWDCPVIPNPNIPPLVFCAVCQQWRRVALATPALWGSLCLSSDFAYSADRADYVDFCRDWISRAGATPLSFSFIMEALQKGKHGSTRALHNFLGKLHQQWRFAEIIRDPTVPDWLQLPSNGTYPFLEALSFSPALSDPPGLSFCDAPKLRSVSLFDYSPQIHLPWHQITSFHTYYIDVCACIKILRDSPNLVDVTLGAIESDDHSPDNSILSHAKLQQLNLGGWFEVDLTTVLKSLTTPALKRLTLEFCGHSPPAHPISPLLSFLTRSSCHLHTLALCLLPARTNALVDCLEAVPSLVNLKLHPPPYVDTRVLFAQFTGRPEFLPALEHFYIVFPKSGIAGVSSATASSIVDMLCWRRSATALKSFHLAHEYDMYVFDTVLGAHPEFRRLKREGMKLYSGHWCITGESFMDET